jgi:hypothetical protein
MKDLQDRDLECSECLGLFTFMLGEQLFFQERDFAEPKRCSSCRRAKRARVETAQQQRLNQRAESFWMGRARQRAGWQEKTVRQAR